MECEGHVPRIASLHLADHPVFPFFIADVGIPRRKRDTDGLPGQSLVLSFFDLGETTVTGDVHDLYREWDLLAQTA